MKYDILGPNVTSFGRLATSHPMWEHPLLARCRDEKLTLSDAVLLAPQLYRITCHFGRILANLAAQCPDEHVQRVIADKLFDEIGRGTPRRSHPALFRRFTRALGISDAGLRSTAPLPETQALIDTFTRLPQDSGWVAGLGALCYASEAIAGSLHALYRRGIARAAQVPRGALAFFDEHIALDDEHIRPLASAVHAHVRTAADARRVEEAIAMAMDARIGFLDGLERQIAVSSASSGRPVSDERTVVTDGSVTVAWSG